jgi:hypothetical protein
MKFVWLFLDPVNCLVRAGKLADTADLPSVEILEPAVGAALGTIKFRNGYSLAVELFAFLKNLIRANLRTEITTLAPGLINGEFHEKCPIVYYSSGGEKNLFFMSMPHQISYFFPVLFIFPFRMLYDSIKEIIAV